MEKKLEKLLDMIIAGVEKGADFAGKEMPLVAEEIINYGFYSSLAGCMVYLSLLIMTLVIAAKLYVKSKEDYCSDYIFGTGIAVLVAVMFLIPTMIEGTSALKAIIAPKLYLLDYLRSAR